jgi:exosortase C (VPDSG-CTERM-specific)
MAWGEISVRRRVAWLVLLVAATAGCFALPLRDLAAYAARTDLYSHALIVPALSAYLVYLRRRRLTWAYAPSPWMATLALVAAAVATALWLGADRWQIPLSRNDRLALTTYAFLVWILAEQLLLLGSRTFDSLAFPMLFLFFMVPMPEAVSGAFNAFLQHASAHALHGVLALSRTPMLREGITFHLPGLTLVVAPECSGIRSTYVLIITSLLAGSVFLRGVRARTILCAVSVPIGILRNAVRIATIALLTINADPDIIRGPLHKQGGPPFFVLSLIPLFGVLLLVRRGERQREAANEQRQGGTHA